MKINLIHGKNWQDESSLRIRVNGKTVISAYALTECPEDATLERDLGYVYEIASLMEDAYNAGKNGEEFVITEEDEDEDE